EAKAREDLQSALAKFEEKWLKTRRAANGRKLKSLAKTEAGKAAAARKSAEAKIKVLEKALSPDAPKPGRPRKAVADEPVARRGRPPKAANAAAPDAAPEAKAPRGRGRPPKASVADTAAAAETKAPRGRGRPPKAKTVAAKPP